MVRMSKKMRANVSLSLLHCHSLSVQLSVCAVAVVGSQIALTFPDG